MSTNTTDPLGGNGGAQPPISTIDLSILINGATSFALSIAFLIIFLAFRRSFKWLYYPNQLSLRLSDAALLSLIGLDGFIYLMTLKLFFLSFFWLSTAAVLILIPIYSMGGSTIAPKGNEIYTMLSILNLTTGSPWLWVPFILTWLFSVFLYYSIFTFYNYYSILRQSYTANPSSLTSILDILNFVQICDGNIGKAYDLINLQSHTILLEGLDKNKFKAEKDVVDWMNQCGIGEVTEAIFIKDHARLRCYINERNALLLTLEKTYMNLLKNVLLAMKKQSQSKVKSKKNDGNTSLPPPLEKLTIKDLIDDKRSYTEVEKKELLMVTLSERFLSNFRPKMRLGWFGRKIDLVNYYTAKLIYLDDKIEAERYRILQLVRRDSSDSPLTTTITTTTRKDDYIYSDSSVYLPFTVISKSTLSDFQLLLPGTTRAAFVTFKDNISSSLACQCLLSSELFSCTASRAPNSNAILWENITLPLPKKKCKETIGTLLFIMINLLWTIPVSFISTVSQLSNVVTAFPALKFLMELPPAVRALIEGSLPPILLNGLILMMPIILKYISRFQGFYSKSEIQTVVLRKYILFLYIQVFLVAFLSGSIWSALTTILNNGDWNAILHSIQQFLPTKSSFFFNMIILRISFDLFFVLANPMFLLFRLFKKGLISNQTPREKQNSHQSEAVDYGVLYPNSIFIIPLVLTYACISPLTLFIGCIYYGIAYYIYRYEFIYALKTSFESGGEAWKNVVDFLILSIGTFQVMTAIQFSVQGAGLQAFLLIPLIFLTIAFKIALQQTYSKRSDYVPLGKRSELTHACSYMLDEKGTNSETTIGEKPCEKNASGYIQLICKLIQEQRKIVQELIDHAAIGKGSSMLHLPPSTENVPLVNFNSAGKISSSGISSLPTLSNEMSDTSMSFEIEKRLNSGAQTPSKGQNATTRQKMNLQYGGSNESLPLSPVADGLTDWYLDNPYRNPLLFKQMNYLYLPRHFFHLCRLVKNGQPPQKEFEGDEKESELQDLADASTILNNRDLKENTGENLDIV